MEVFSDSFFPNRILNRNIFLNRGYMLKIEGVFKMSVTPPLVALYLTQISMAVTVTASG